VDLAADSALPAFRTRLMRKDELGAMARLMKESVLRTLEQLEERRGQLPEDVAARAAAVLACREQLTARFGEIEYLDAAVKLARVHGDYHLGQVLRTTDDFVILDFEGEPARPLAERRAPQSPLKDVAGMLRSFSYAANAALGDFRLAHPESRLSKRWASLWETGVATVFLESYRAAVAGTRLIPEREDDIARLLGAFLLDKAVYELGYELNNRQAWINIPLEAVAGWCREPRAFERPRWKEMSSV
jgi:maltose alpha-D-glucosyltransferase/alpha-amylase